jgi:WD40 repeat protein
LTKSGTGKGSLQALTLIRPHDSKQWAFYDLASSLQAATVNDVKTLVCVNETTLRDGTYTDKSPAYKLIWDVKLLKYPDGTLIGGRKFTGDPPPAVKAGGGARYGNPPKQEFTTWLNDQLSDGTIFQHSYELTGLALSPDGKTLASLGTDRVIKIWKIPSTTPLPINNGKSDLVSSVAFSSDGKLIGGGSLQGFIYVWNASSYNKTIKSAAQHTGAVNQVVFAPDGKTIASAGTDKRVRVWDVANGKQLAAMGLAVSVEAIAFSPDGKAIAAGGKDSVIRIWDTTGKEIASLSQGSITSLAFSPDGRNLIAADSLGTIKIWDVIEKKEMASWSAHTGGVNGVTVSANGQLIASGGGDGVVKVWNLANGKEINSFRGSRAAIVGVSFAADNKTIAAGSLDGTVKLWTVSP